MIYLRTQYRATKNFSKHSIIDLIRFSPGGISRAEISRQLQLPRTTVTGIIRELKAGGIVHEIEAAAQSGNKPVRVEINPSYAYVVGIDLGATHGTYILADASARVVREMEIALDVRSGPVQILDLIDQNLDKLLDIAGVERSKVMAIGMGVPGPVVSRDGVVSAPPIMPGWDGYPIRAELHRRWPCQITINNDAELGALGEWAYGVGRGEDNLAYIKVGTGIGAGFLIDGQVYHGVTGGAGEIGHMTIQSDGPLCSCGNRGCLESIAGGEAIARRTMEYLHQGRKSSLSAIHPLERLGARDVFAAASRGDALAQVVMREMGVHIGTATANLVNLFNPGIVVIGGGGSQVGDLLLEPVRQAVGKRSLRISSRSVRITTALLGRRSSAMGAVAKALSSVLHQFDQAEAGLRSGGNWLQPE
jgi:glucokinase-like ROK family protein